MQVTLKNYANLLQKLQKNLREAEQNITKEINHQKILVSWKIGKEIDTHLEKNSDSGYGKKLFSQLAQDTAISEKTLYQMRSFYKAYPDLTKVEKSLSWSHYRNLVTVKNTQQRKYLEDLTVRQNLDSKELQKEVAKLNKSKKSSRKNSAEANSKTLKVTRGQIAIGKIVKLSGSKKNFLDLGFNVFQEISGKFENGEIVEVKKSGQQKSFKKITAKSNQLYTYKARLERVVDGDTLHVILDLGFGIEHREILRLTQINAPEFKTSAGKKSATALRKILQDVEVLVVKTNKTDIYGRYLADVFFDEKKQESNSQKIADKGTYLSQLLLDNNLAEKY